MTSNHWLLAVIGAVLCAAGWLASTKPNVLPPQEREDPEEWWW